MRTPTRTTTTALALALAVALGGCNGGGGEPTDSTSTASGPSSSTSKDQELHDSAETAFKKFWDASQAVSPSDVPDEDTKKLLTDEAYLRQVEFSKTAAPTKVEEEDKITATSVKTDWSTAGPTASVEVCYTVHRRLILTKDVKSADGKTLKKGRDVRTDPNGKSIKPGTEMVNLVTMKRGRQDDDPWKVDSTKVGYKTKCGIKGKAS